jgi:hypothetical protein
MSGVEGPLLPEQRRQRVRRHGAIVVVGLCFVVVAVTVLIAIPPGSDPHGFLFGLASIGAGMVVVAALAIALDRTR